LVAVILLIAITVAAAVVISGVFFNLAGIAGRRPTANIDSVKLVVSPTTGAGAFSLVLKNTGDVPMNVTGTDTTTVSTVSLTGLPSGCGIPNTLPTASPSITWTGSGLPGNTVSISGTANSGCGGLLGKTVGVTVTVRFADGSVQTLSTGVTATIA
jgi:FlaG/FlaF family flagellin (archaellin)